jgi:hypothetical protein
MAEAINVPIAAVQHHVEPGQLPGAEIAVGLHPGHRRLDAVLLGLQALGFFGSDLPGGYPGLEPIRLMLQPPVDFVGGPLRILLTGVTGLGLVRIAVVISIRLVLIGLLWSVYPGRGVTTPRPRVHREGDGHPPG